MTGEAVAWGEDEQMRDQRKAITSNDQMSFTQSCFELTVRKDKWLKEKAFRK